MVAEGAGQALCKRGCPGWGLAALLGRRVGLCPANRPHRTPLALVRAQPHLGRGQWLCRGGLPGRVRLEPRIRAVSDLHERAPYVGGRQSATGAATDPVCLEQSGGTNSPLSFRPWVVVV